MTMTTTTGTTASSPLRSVTKKDAGPTPPRARVNSRDIPRSYSGMFGQGGDDMLPFELARTEHTDWLENGGVLLLVSYLGVIAIFELIVLAIVDTLNVSHLYWSWTVTNFTHCVLSVIYLHWLKGSLFDNQGEMAAMTLWEQLEGRQNNVAVKRALTIVPTLICYAACHFSNYHADACAFNIVLWAIHIFAKLPAMNGVRIFGINRTTGIDDYGQKAD